MEKNKPKKKEEYVRICPKCNSSETTFYKDGGVFSTGALPDSFECLNCGFVGTMFPEVNVEELSKIEVKKSKDNGTKYKGDKLVDTSYGDFYVRGVWKLFGPATIFFGLIFIWKALTQSTTHQFLILGLIIVLIGLVTSYFAYRKIK